MLSSLNETFNLGPRRHRRWRRWRIRGWLGFALFALLKICLNGEDSWLVMYHHTFANITTTSKSRGPMIKTDWLVVSRCWCFWGGNMTLETDGGLILPHTIYTHFSHKIALLEKPQTRTKAEIQINRRWRCRWPYFALLSKQDSCEVRKKLKCLSLPFLESRLSSLKEWTTILGS